MVVLKVLSEFGHAPPPQTPYSIITNLPGWDMLHDMREGDTSPLSKVVHIYPRIMPSQFARQLCREVAKRLGLEDKSCMLYLNPLMWQHTSGHVVREQRGEKAISPAQLTFRVVDVAGHRLYAVLFNSEHAGAVSNSWVIPGLGLSIRGAEHFLKHIDGVAEVPCDFDKPPEPTWTPEGPAHDELRHRIVQLLHHGAIDSQKIQCQPRDVFLFPSGMAAIFHTKNILQAYRPGTNVELGVVFRHTHDFLLEESPGGWKHFGRVNRDALDSMEVWLREVAEKNGKVSFVVVEFPGNPTLETVDLRRLKEMSTKHGFLLIVDDTISGFGNVDVLEYSDIQLTSLTKSFSGQANVLGGSVVLNPLSSHYDELLARFKHDHRNELFTTDAEVLLANSETFFARSARLNDNAKVIADFLYDSIGQPDSPVTKVLYPSLLSSKPEYDAFKRRSTPELPEPGYGCLLTVDFENVDTARAFYDSCGFYPSPHLGGHVTIMFAYNMFTYGKTSELREQYRQFGAKEESIRISAGLEDVNDLIDTLQVALDAAIEAKKNNPSA